MAPLRRKSLAPLRRKLTGRGGFPHRGRRLALDLGGLAGVPQGLVQRVQVARGGAHLAASRGALQQGWFSESMFLRLAPLSITGQWHGRTYG